MKLNSRPAYPEICTAPDFDALLDQLARCSAVYGPPGYPACIRVNHADFTIDLDSERLEITIYPVDLDGVFISDPRRCGFACCPMPEPYPANRETIRAALEEVLPKAMATARERLRESMQSGELFMADWLAVAGPQQTLKALGRRIAEAQEAELRPSSSTLSDLRRRVEQLLAE